MTESSDLVLLERSAGVATVTLNRPQKLNAMSVAMVSQLAAAFAQVASDSDLRCVLLKGAGRAFCPGADIGEFGQARASRDEAEKFAQHFHSALAAISNCPLPVIAVIRGACVGGGLQLACLCDLRISSENGRFGIPVNRIGLTVDYEELSAIYHVIGAPNLLEMLLEGRILSAAEASRKGLLTRVVADDRLDAEARMTAERVADGAPLVNRWHKKFVRRLGSPEPLTPDEIAESFLCFDTRDYQIGYEAFLNKPKPNWEGC